MTTKTKKRNTAIFFALLSQIPGYDSRYRDLVKESVIDGFLTAVYGERHGRELRLSMLSDSEYNGLVKSLKNDLNKAATAATAQDRDVRRRLTHQILNALSGVGVRATGGDYSEVNRHVGSLPISGGRTIPQFRTEELPVLLNAVRAYCDVIRKKQQKIEKLVKLN